MTKLSRSELKALASHRVLAERLNADHSLVTIVKRRISWLIERNPAGAPYYRQWHLVDQQERARIYRETAEAIDRQKRH